ncbi:hypothetical protein P1X15_08880 [Runella sp. MFBS21]|uniref:hypothetical protein n=1 Tax=Runella sp. MFBS21 TaxID=3034018 RepID=UPI0023F75871|nr:hypothetical protein [Runella sp. MFBS21]MDF7817709.1 hypothetical protein [Runella sp. MFBS21]
MDTTDIFNDLEMYGSSKNGTKVVMPKGKKEGSCWEFVEMALIENNYKYHNEGGLGEDLYAWGSPIDISTIRTGDILQFTNHIFTLKDGRYFKRGPKHTAIVSTVNDSKAVVGIWEQHVTKPSKVVFNKVYLSPEGECTVVEGTVKAYRPIKK